MLIEVISLIKWRTTILSNPQSLSTLGVRLGFLLSLVLTYMARKTVILPPIPPWVCRSLLPRYLVLGSLSRMPFTHYPYSPSLSLTFTIEIRAIK